MKVNESRASHLGEEPAKKISGVLPNEGLA
jgi:hypothetical protein